MSTSGVTGVGASASSPSSLTIARSMRGRARTSSSPSVTIWNSREAVRSTIALARSGSSIPASSTMIRSSPTFWMVGSRTPNSSIRFRIVVSVRSIASARSSGGRFGLSISIARCIPPWRSSPRFRGEIFSPVGPSFGIKAHAHRRSSPPIRMSLALTVLNIRYPLSRIPRWPGRRPRPARLVPACSKPAKLSAPHGRRKGEARTFLLQRDSEARRRSRGHGAGAAPKAIGTSATAAAVTSRIMTRLRRNPARAISGTLTRWLP